MKRRYEKMRGGRRWGGKPMKTIAALSDDE